VDAVRATRPPFDPAEVVKDYSDFLKLYGVDRATGDNYAGEWPVAEFAKNGIAYQQAEKTKSELYLSLIPVMTSRRVELLDNDKLKTELRRLERRRGRSGKDSIDHPSYGGSDDVANACAGAVWLASNGGANLDDFLAQNQLAPERTCDPRHDWLDQEDGSGNLTAMDRYLDSVRRGGGRGWGL